MAEKKKRRNEVCVGGYSYQKICRKVGMKQNKAGKWVPDGNTTTFSSNTLYDDPYVKIKNEFREQDASVKTDFYVTYDVKSEYSRLYSGAATEGESKASAFLVKQGDKYAKIDGTSLATESAHSLPENIEDISLTFAVLKCVISRLVRLQQP